MHPRFNLRSEDAQAARADAVLLGRPRGARATDQAAHAPYYHPTFNLRSPPRGASLALGSARL
eukprot:1737265-Prymnesium_polylepis.1